MANKNTPLIALKAIEQYIPVMSSAEVEQLAKGTLVVTPEMFERWTALLGEREAQQQAINDKIQEAYAKQR